MIGVSVAKYKESEDIGDMIVTTDYMTAGNLIGEFSLLTGSPRTSSCTCETSVQVRIPLLRNHFIYSDCSVSLLISFICLDVLPSKRKDA